MGAAAWVSPKSSGVPATPASVDDGASDNGRTVDLDSPFDLSLARRAQPLGVFGIRV